MSENMIPGVAEVAAGGFSFGAGIVFIRWFIGWLTGRHDHREERLDRRWSEYMDAQDKHVAKQDARIEQQGKRIDTLEGDVELCHSEKRELERRIAQLEGFATGRGEAVQIGQIGSSLDSQIKRRLGRDEA